jgi:hypothetical protein
VVYAKEPFAGPEEVLRYLSRYTHRVAISNRRLVSADEKGVTFKYKDYRIEGPGRYKTMTLATDEFIRRFLIHVVPKGFHRIRHYGLLASANRAANIAHARKLLAMPLKEPKIAKTEEVDEPSVLPRPCPCCGARMIIIETFARVRAQAPTDTRACGDQVRHLMMPSLTIRHRSDTRHSRRLSTGNAPACVDPSDWPATPAPFWSRNLRSDRSALQAHPRLGAKPSARPLRLIPFEPDDAAKSP